MKTRFEKGTKIIIRPTAPGIQKSARATKWLHKKQVVTLLEYANAGTWDVYDVETSQGKEESIYGFNIVRQSRTK